MSIVITETDYGTKQKLVDASRRTAMKIEEKFKEDIDDWWNKVLFDAWTFCPKDTGALSDSLRIEEGVPDVSSYYGVAGGMEIPESDISDKSIVVGGTTINPKTGQPVNYAEAVHDGHITRDGRWIPAEPFLTDALEINMPELETLLQRIWRECEDEFNKD